MSLVGIKNKYLRRTILVVAIPFIYTVGAVGVGVYNLWSSILEMYIDMPPAIVSAWRGR